MRKQILLASAALLLGASPALAQENGGADGDSSLELDLRYANNIDTSVVTDVTFTKDVSLTGNVELDGFIDVDSAAVAVTDAKQFITGVAVLFREENELDGENGFVDPLYGPGVSEAGQDPNDSQTDGVLQDRIRVGFFAPIILNARPGDITASGNVGVNVAAGWFNQQANIATIATSGGGSSDDEDGDNGWSEASTTASQSLLGVLYGRAGDELSEDDEETGGGGNNFRERYTATTGAVSGDGNIGVNVAAGAFNMQQNIMTLATASDSALAEANAGVIQSILLGGAEIQDAGYRAETGAISGAGNIGVNSAAGVGNMQHNSLTIAASQGSGDAGAPGDDGDGS